MKAWLATLYLLALICRACSYLEISSVARRWRGSHVREAEADLGQGKCFQGIGCLRNGHFQTRSSTSLRSSSPLASPTTIITALTPWYQDDLPNILGINPLEAAVIFGALYYFYGPTTLYKYTREAGVFFSTYAPVVKDVVTDIFNEFRDYLDEDREREDLKNAGVNVDNIPRRTTNIIERFQESLDTFSEMSSSLDVSGNAIDNEPYTNSDDIGEYDEDISSSEAEVSRKTSTRKEVEREKEETFVNEEGKTSRRKKRKSKKEIIAEQDSSTTATLIQSAIFDEQEYLNDVDRSLVQSVNTIKDQLENLQQPAQSDYTFSDTDTDAAAAAASAGEDTSLMNQQMQVQAMMAARRAQEAEEEATTAKSRFAAQLSGDWNAQVMDSTTTSDNSPNLDEYGWPDMTTYNADLGLESTSSLGYGDVPDIVSSSDIVGVSPSPSESCSDSPSNDIDSLDARAARDMLYELDRDYQSLRQRVVSFIETQESRSSKDSVSNMILQASDDENKVGRYWPPTKTKDYSKKIVA